MSKYKCTFEKALYCAWVDSELILDPKDYILYEDEFEFMGAVREDMRDACNTGDVQWKDSDIEWHIPNEFIQEWKSLKGLK